MTIESQYGKLFYKQAQTAIDAISDDVLDVVLSGKIEGRWHPNGFVIFRLGNFQSPEYLSRNVDHGLNTSETSTLGQLRLHVWPRGHRVTAANHPPTHSHSWWLCSKILAGKYTDTVFPRINIPVASDTRYVKYAVEYKNENEADIVPTEDEVFIRTGPTRSRNVGEFHLMAPDHFHQNEIENESMCVTLLIMSDLTPGSDVIIGPGGGPRLAIKRRAISGDEASTIFEQLSIGL